MNTNSNKRAFQFQFEIFLKSLTVEYNSTFNFKLTIKRGTRVLETKNTLKYEQGERRDVEINDQFNIIATLGLQNQKTDKLQELQDKIYKLYLQVYTKQGFKNATYAEINFASLIKQAAEFLNDILAGRNCPELIKSPLELDFIKHPFGYLKLKLVVNIKFLSEIDLVNNPNDFSRLSVDCDGEEREILKEKANIKESDYSTEKEAQFIISSERETKILIPNISITPKIKSSSSSNVITNLRPSNHLSPSSVNVPTWSSSVKNDQSEEITLLNETIKVTNKKVEELESEKRSLNETLNGLQNTVTDLKQQLQNQQQVNLQLASNKNGSTSSNTTANLRMLTGQLKDKEIIISELKSENEYFADENSQLKSIITELKAEKTKVYEEKLKVIKEQKEDLDKMKTKLKSIERELINGNRENESLKVKIEASHSSEQSFKKKIMDLELDLKKEKESSDKKIRQFELEREDKENRKKEELEQMERKHINLLAQSEAEINKTQTLLEEMKKRIDVDQQTADTKIKNLQSEYSTLEERLLSLTNERSENQQAQSKQEKELTKDLQMKQTEVDIKEQIIKDTKQELLKMRSIIEVLEDQVKFYESEKELNKERFLSGERKYKEDLVSLRQKLTQKDEELQHISNEKETVRFECDKLRQELKKLETSKNSDDLFFSQINEMQNKYNDKENKLLEDKEAIIKTLRKELENLITQSKKQMINTEKELYSLQTENQKLKSDITYLNAELNNNREQKDKIIKFENSNVKLQNLLAVNKVELTQSQMESDKYREDFYKQEATYKAIINELNEKILILQNELVVSKQKIGDMLNEIGEYEGMLTSNKDKSVKKKFSEWFKKKNKNEDSQKK